jgi:hypothetical protein
VISWEKNCSNSEKEEHEGACGRAGQQQGIRWRAGNLGGERCGGQRLASSTERKGCVVAGRERVAAS